MLLYLELGTTVLLAGTSQTCKRALTTIVQRSTSRSASAVKVISVVVSTTWIRKVWNIMAQKPQQEPEGPPFYILMGSMLRLGFGGVNFVVDAGATWICAGVTEGLG